MSTSDQQGRGPLTRKQMRELRLTGSTPVITPEEAAAAAAAAAAAPPAPPAPSAPEAEEVPPAPRPDSSVDLGAPPLTRRQARDQERIRTASVPVMSPETDSPVDTDTPAETEPPVETGSAEDTHAEAPVVDVPLTDVPDDEEVLADDADAEDEGSSAEPILSAVPTFVAPATSDEVVSAEADAADDDEIVDAEIVGESDDAEGVHGLDTDADLEAEDTAEAKVDSDAFAPRDAGTSNEQPTDAPSDDEVPSDGSEPLESDEDGDAASEAADEILAADEHEDDADTGERPTVNPAFGQSLLRDSTVPSLAPSFDELITSNDSTGSQHIAPSALIFTPSPGEGSLSGPVASTGELLVTGSYDLPAGMGSLGHARGTTDGKDIDSVLIDGELPPASSPTPIAASSAVSTIKPAGEVIRPPAPEAGNKLMLTLAITAGGLALVLAAALVFAFTTGVF
ncbi:MAG: hypothetical protein ACQEW8_03185 [Actinomycetota bacterium]